MNKLITSILLSTLLSLSPLGYAQQSTPASDAKENNNAVQTPSDSSNAVITSININSATAEQLSLLSGIGSAKAAAIIDYREQNGPFNSVDDLSKVSGIGERTVEKNRHLLTK
ncbi:ComEA family DNA-binding protein [Oceanisphaera avium]|uniref:Helix-hairpin-helix DNA-binding motif class 1 domain-containing protein n=1 Tax=Oceanisphaera avium TaxID=1903694 RepID=A0A1Y0CVQ7_9GAMM|nr:hypothetical protein CBP12_01385 [Oceanisphaera avium]